jgi:hypothetical protein
MDLKKGIFINILLAMEMILLKKNHLATIPSKKTVIMNKIIIKTLDINVNISLDAKIGKSF